MIIVKIGSPFIINTSLIQFQLSLGFFISVLISVLMFFYA